jgi:AraC-like ligand binding domain
MPKVSRATASRVQDFGAAEDRSDEFEGYTLMFVTLRETADLTPALEGLPGDSCPCPHWGYMTKGRMTVRYADHEEVIEPGDAFYMPPGHVPRGEGGSEFLIISPTEPLEAITAAMGENMARKMAAAQEA